MMTVRAPEARAHSHSPALAMLPARWRNGPRGPINATQRRQVMQETSRRSNSGCRAASATPVPTRRRERTTSPHHDEAYLLFFHHVKYFFSCGVCFFFLDKIIQIDAYLISTLPRHAAQCELFLCLTKASCLVVVGAEKKMLTKLEPPDEQSSCLKSELCKDVMQSTLFLAINLL